MNAHALLTSQGWRGTGHSLHSASDAIGLSRPILVAQKQNVLGVGRKQHKTSDLWWMNAFDKTLKGIEVTASKPKLSEGEKEAEKRIGDGHDHDDEEEEEGVQVVQTMTSGGLDMVVKGGRKYVGGKGGLYACFVRGEGLSGTMGTGVEEVVCVKESKAEAELQSGSGLGLKSKSKSKSKSKLESKSKSESGSESKKRKRDIIAEAEPLEIAKKEIRAKKSAKGAGKAGVESGITATDTEMQTSARIRGGVADESLPAIEPETETKEQRRERRRLKKLRKLSTKDAEEGKEKEAESKIRTSSDELLEDRRRKKKERKAAKKEVGTIESAKEINAEDSPEKKKRKTRRKEDRD